MRARSINYYIITHVHHVGWVKYKKNAMLGYELIEGGVYFIDAACVCGVYTRAATTRGWPLFEEIR